MDSGKYEFTSVTGTLFMKSYKLRETKGLQLTLELKALVLETLNPEVLILIFRTDTFSLRINA